MINNSTNNQPKKRTNIYKLKTLNIKKAMTYDVGNPCLGL